MVVLLVAVTGPVLAWPFRTTYWAFTSGVPELLAVATRPAGIVYWAEAVAFRALDAVLPLAWAEDVLPVMEKLEVSALGSEYPRVPRTAAVAPTPPVAWKLLTPATAPRVEPAFSASALLALFTSASAVVELPSMATALWSTVWGARGQHIGVADEGRGACGDRGAGDADGRGRLDVLQRQVSRDARVGGRSPLQDPGRRVARTVLSRRGRVQRVAHVVGDRQGEVRVARHVDRRGWPPCPSRRPFRSTSRRCRRRRSPPPTVRTPGRPVAA